jgi:glutathione synthase/RimK-type ligase-like ATP-grasp enzyme
MKKISFLTSQEYPALTPDDQLASHALEKLGAKVEPLIWDQFSLPHQSDAYIVRSPWDYFAKFDLFNKVIQGLPDAKLHNSKKIIFWNMNKTYLRELVAKGVNVIPTYWIPGKVNLSEAQEWISKNAAEGFVVKSSVSAGGHDTFLHKNKKLAEEMIFKTHFPNEEIMVQSFCPEIQKEGEWSLLFFNGKFSHSILKKPSSTEFRVQEKLGGSVEVAKAPESLIKQAQDIVALSPEVPLYARVDGVLRNGRLMLMELEVLEPSLFLAQCHDAPERLAKAILSRAG